MKMHFHSLNVNGAGLVRIPTIVYLSVQKHSASFNPSENQVCFVSLVYLINRRFLDRWESFYCLEHFDSKNLKKQQSQEMNPETEDSPCIFDYLCELFKIIIW